MSNLDRNKVASRLAKECDHFLLLACCEGVFAVINFIMHSSGEMIIRNRSSKDIIGALSQPNSLFQSLRNGSSGTADGGAVLPSSGRSPSIHRWFIFLLICFFGMLCYSLLIYHSPMISIRQEHARPLSASVEQVTIVMNTFKRHDMMLGDWSIPILLYFSVR